jgi:hypothetical protein
MVESNDDRSLCLFETFSNFIYYPKSTISEECSEKGKMPNSLGSTMFIYCLLHQPEIRHGFLLDVSANFY